ncbi:MAG: murein L,D-transpeptidase catalytic domain-containing protein [Vicinamibacterales bacterium]
MGECTSSTSCSVATQPDQPLRNSNHGHERSHSEAFIKANGRLGRSWGCLALRNDIAQEVIDRIEGGGLVFAYYPDPIRSKPRSFSAAVVCDSRQT